MSASVSIPDVVEVLKKDPNVFNQIVKIADILDIPTASSQPIINLFNLSIKPGYELLREFLIIWVGCQGLKNATVGSLSTLLEKGGFRAAAESLSKLGPTTQITFSTSSNIKPQPDQMEFGVKSPNPKFVGRLTELEEIQAHYKNASTKCLVVSGMGGQGKSELCKKFIDQNPKPSSLITWLNGDSYQQLMTSFQELARELKLSITDDSGKPLQIKPLIQQISRHFHDKLQSDSLWLIIIDNVDEEYPEFEDVLNVFIYDVKIKCFLLITSRRNNIFPGEARQLQLQTLAPADAQQLIKNILQNSTEDDIIILCEELGNHALALQQASAFILQKQHTGIKGRAYSIQDYLEEFNEHQKSVLQHPIKFSNYDKTIHSIVQTTLKNMRNNKDDNIIWTEEVGMILGLINPDGIHIKSLYKLIHIFIKTHSLADEWTEKITEVAVLELAKFSLIDVNNEIISLHRVVQAVLRLECDWKANIHTFLNNVDFKNRSKDELFHLNSIWRHVSEYPEIVKKCPGPPTLIFFRMNELSVVLRMSDFAERNHALLVPVLGPQHASTVVMEFNVALVLYDMGEYEEALTKLYKVLDKMKLILGEDHSYSMEESNLIANVLWRMGKLKEALEWHEKVLKSKQKVFGDNHENTMTTRNNMALVLSDLGRRGEALSIYDDVLKWKEENLGPSHLSTLVTRHNRATLLYEEGQLIEAKAEFEAVLEIKIQILGEEHVDTLDTKIWLADTLWELGEKKKALEMMEEVLVGREKVLGMNHPTTEMTRENVSKYRMEIYLEKD